MKRYDFAQHNRYYETWHQMDPADDGEWVRYEDVRALEQALARVQALVNEQAEDDGLWFVAVTASEAYLQSALRELHARIEERVKEVLRDCREEA